MWKFNEEEKDAIEYFVAIGMLLFGCGLTIFGFIVPPLGEVHPSVITVLGETLIFSGAVFHLNLSFKRKDEEFRGEIRNELDKFKDKLINKEGGK